MPYSDESVPEELDTVLRGLLSSENLKYEMHRNALENILQNMLAAAQESDYYESLEDDEKRSIATLAKNGQLPSKEPDTEMGSLGEDDNGHKRNLASMARSGLIGGKRNIQALKQWNYAGGKRNIGSIRGNLLQGGKRNMAALARNGFGKRNVGALARDWALPKFNAGSKYMDGWSKQQSKSITFLIHLLPSRWQKKHSGDEEFNQKWSQEAQRKFWRR